MADSLQGALSPHIQRLLQNHHPLVSSHWNGFFLWIPLGCIRIQREKDGNDAILADVVGQGSRVFRLVDLATKSPTMCLETFEGDTADRDALAQHMEECGGNLSEELSVILEDVVQETTVDAYTSLTFDWIACQSGDLGDYADRWEQAEHVIATWWVHFDSLRTQYEAEGLSSLEAEKRAREEARGGEDCRTNVAAAALFWFTIMTTIGYGNVAPVTKGGRAVVYTLGIISILIFTALIGQAGYICLVVVDDFLIRCRLKRLTQGILAAMLWLALFIVWMLVIAGVAFGWSKSRQGEFGLADFADAFWFAYISVTTVGLGDLHIPPDVFQPADMFYIPLLFLIGFVLLANFLLKLSTILTSHGVSQDRSLEGILEESRRKRGIENEAVTMKSVEKDKEQEPGDEVQPISAAKEELSSAAEETPPSRSATHDVE